MTVVVAATRPLLARDVMSAPTISVPPTTSIWSAWAVMMRSGLRHLVVAADDSCLGVIDDRTVFAEWPMGPLALRRRTVRELLRPCTSCVLPDTELQVVAQAMVDDVVDAVPVVDVDGQLIGIVTATDLTRAVAAAGVWLKEES